MNQSIIRRLLGLLPDLSYHTRWRNGCSFCPSVSGLHSISMRLEIEALRFLEFWHSEYRFLSASLACFAHCSWVSQSFVT